jgi:methylated-DNA-protein-cysteine methyltransferase-like protein
MPYDPERHGPTRISGPGFHTRVHELVRQVPAGEVTTYGDLATALGLRGLARQVGQALAALPAGTTVPWWRVVDGSGRITRAGTGVARRQRQRLAREGVAVAAGRVVGFTAIRWSWTAARRYRTNTADA